MPLRVDVFVPFQVGHDIWTLQAQVQRPQRYNGPAVGGVLVRLRNDTGFLIYVLQYRPVVLECLLSRILNHRAHVLYVLSAIMRFQNVAWKRTAAISNMRHLATRNNRALRILNKLRARQRRRLRSCLHLLLVLRFRDAVWLRYVRLTDKRSAVLRPGSLHGAAALQPFLRALTRGELADRAGWVMSPGCSLRRA